jgi:hypothetical protein
MATVKTGRKPFEAGAEVEDLGGNRSCGKLGEVMS